MEPDQTDRLIDLVADALERTPEERRAFLDAECGANEALRIEVQSLIGQAEVAGGFLQTPAFAQEGKHLHDLEAGTLKPGDTLGDCQIIRLLGEGGMGEVYLAQDTKLERLVAVKLLKTQLDDDMLVRRFRHERKVLAGLTHPNIARLYGGATTSEGRSYLIIEHIDGERLDRYCAARDLPLTERLALFRKVCAAVAYAHQNLVIHRDLKPANIRVTAEGEPKLLDFGVAKLLDPEGGAGTRADPTVTLSAAMTPEYASPEQLRGETITTTTDVYSLGVVLYELLTGERPYRVNGRRPDELARAICEQPPDRPSTMVGRRTATTGEKTAGGETQARLRRRLEGDLDNIVTMALRKEPSRRYDSVAQFSEDVRRHCEGLPVVARKDTLGYRVGKFVQRNKVGVGAAAVVVFALLAGLLATIWQARVARQERDRAQVAQMAAEVSRKQAESALERATVAQRQTQQINDFLQKILGSASPAKLGKDAKVIQVLDAASANVDEALANEPEVLAQVQQTLGSTYSNLGMVKIAEQHYRASLAILRRLYGEQDGRTVDAELALATALLYQNDFEETEPLLLHVIDWLRRQPANEDLRLAKTLSHLGFCFTYTHRFQEAESSFNESLALYARSAGEESIGYASTLGQFGLLKRESGDLGGAITATRSQLAILNRIAPDNNKVVVAEINLCSALIEARKFSDAETLLESAKRDCRRIVGENDNMLYTNVLFMSELLDFEHGDFAKVATEGKNILERFSAYLSRDEFFVVTADYLLGASLTRSGHAVEGEALLRMALTNFNPVKRALFLVYGNAETALGDCLLAQKRYAEAESLLLTGYHKLQQDPNEQVASLAASVRLHDLYTDWNRPADAERFAVGGARQDSTRP